MTCWFDPSQGTFDAYDHEGMQIAADEPITDSWYSDEDNRLVGPPQDFLDVLYEARDGDQPSSYNQELGFNINCRQFEEGTPP